MKLTVGKLRKLIKESVSGSTPKDFNDFRTQLADALEASGGPEDAVMDLSYLDKMDGQVVALAHETWNELKNEFFDAGMSGQWVNDPYVSDLVYELVYNIASNASQAKTFSRRPGWQGDPEALANSVLKHLGG